ncbi:MAG: septum site-determining protein MinC [Ardenticatenaceae bacterium]|nr:septum site-determining protein MinC [Ardenticatenaceae bacterium]HBY98992.1 septum site-determining protein MinC [Chloroflexota bacterium]
MSEVALKGERDGLAITIGPEGDFDEVCSAIAAHLERGGQFFRGASVLIDLGPRHLTADQLDVLRTLLSDHGVTLTALRGDDPATRAAALKIGLELPFLPTPTTLVAEDYVPANSELALIIRRTLRSGQAVHHQAAVVVLGDVNPGAQVIAGGDVIVFGALRGVVHAGASGDDQRVVCALELAPTQLRIGGYIARAPDEKRRRSRLPFRRKHLQPEVARVQNNTIVVEPWMH